MGANRTQAQAVCVFLIAFTLISAGLAMDINYLLVAAGVAGLAGSIMLFLKCKPWEHNEE